MLDFVAQRGRRAGLHDDHRVGPGHPERQHDLHQRGRPLRPGRAAPASRPRRAVQAPGVLLPAAAGGAAGHAGVAAKRLKAIEEFSELGAGFQIAMRDLEIRGAGNILGAEQSGHIAAVGYELYCQLLEQAVRELKHEKVEAHTEIDIDLQLDAYIPSTYVRSEMLKMEMYRQLARARAVGEVQEAEREMEDRFGPAPVTAVNLVAKHRLRVRLEPIKFTYFGLRNDHVLVKFDDRVLAEKAVARSGAELRILTDRSAHLMLPMRVRTPDQVLDFAEQVFSG